MNRSAAADDKFQQVDDSKNLSQLIRSNAPHYWANLKREIDLASLKPYLRFEGTVAGDPHMGNFSVLPLKRLGGTRELVFANIDFDDAGQGPFVLDYIRYEIAAKAASRSIKKRALQKAYFAGLAQTHFAPPPQVSKLLAMSPADYDHQVADYTA